MWNWIIGLWDECAHDYEDQEVYDPGLETSVWILTCNKCGKEFPWDYYESN